MEYNEKDIMYVEDVREELRASVKLKRLKRKLISWAAVAVAVALSVGIIVYQNGKISDLKDQIDKLIVTPVVIEPVTPVIDLAVIDTELKEIGELATMNYLYTNAAQFTDSKQIKNWNIPFTQKSFIVKWNGEIKAGVDVNGISTKLDKGDKVLTVCIPEAKILSHDPDEENAELLDEKSGLFNPISVEDKIKFDATMVEEMEKRAIEQGLLEKAQENAETVILNLLEANPAIKGTYSIEFEVVKK